ncbi:fluoride efflux transporter FluC [Tomitella biformata]|uniref:fluoride efflux transporter FluC n=1 Tax=Tomitella biformata TaxID=630403 RepID=UPI0004650302
MAVGGFLGALARFELGEAFPQTAGQWPATTFAINVAGAFALGVLLEALLRLGPDSGWRQRVRLGAGTGVLGAFTTYSALAVDTALLLRAGQQWSALSYAGGTVLAGLVATLLGIAVGARVGGRRVRG